MSREEDLNEAIVRAIGQVLDVLHDVDIDANDASAVRRKRLLHNTEKIRDALASLNLVRRDVSVKRHRVEKAVPETVNDHHFQGRSTIDDCSICGERYAAHY